MPNRARPTLALAIASAALAAGCVRREEPPGAALEPAPSAAVVNAAESGSAAAPEAKGAAPSGEPVPGTPEDNLPFSPDGTKLASIAWRNWIYTDVGRDRTRYGYLRAG